MKFVLVFVVSVAFAVGLDEGRRDRSQPYSLHLSWRSYAFITMHRVSPPLEINVNFLPMLLAL